jgi:hypothetical protein
MMTSRQHAELARAAGSYEYLCSDCGLTFWSHEPHGHVLEHVTPEQHHAQFDAGEYC